MNIHTYTLHIYIYTYVCSPSLTQTAPVKLCHSTMPFLANLQLATGDGSGMAASGVIKRGWLGISI